MVRFKSRHILCEVCPSSPVSLSIITQSDVYHAVFEAVARLHGDYAIGTLKASLAVKYWNADTQICLIRAKRGAHTLVQSAIPFIKEMKQIKLCFRTLHLGGTIRSCQKFLLRYHRQQIPELMAEMEEGDKSKIQKYLTDIDTSLKIRQKQPVVSLNIEDYLNDSN